MLLHDFHAGFIATMTAASGFCLLVTQEDKSLLRGPSSAFKCYLCYIVSELSSLK